MAVHHYQVKITTVGYVHVGNGKEYGKKDYFVKSQASNKSADICIIDPVAFTAKLTSEQLKDYCSFLSDTNPRQGLDEFLESKRLKQLALNAASYVLNSKISKTRQGYYQYFNIFEFIKDAYGCPYIPGSSLKGVLRTALMAAAVSDGGVELKSLCKMEKKDVKSKTADSRIDKKVFWVEQLDPNDKAALSDIMRYISVGDSAPLSTDDLVLAKKYDKFSRNDEAKHKRRMGNQAHSEVTDGNELNIYRECLRPGTVLEFRLDVDDSIIKHFPQMQDSDGILEIFSQLDARYEENFVSKFDLGSSNKPQDSNKEVQGDRCGYVFQSGPLEGMCCPNTAINGTGRCGKHQASAEEKTGTSESITCYLGGGLDFNTKTIFNALYDNDTERLDATSHILFEQFPTKIGESRDSAALKDIVSRAGFDWRPMKNQYRRDGRLSKAKDDHRHWMDKQLGVSPHTLKMGIVEGKKLPMGKCKLSIVPLPNHSRES